MRSKQILKVNKFCSETKPIQFYEYRSASENDDCEFTVVDDPNQPGKLMATRIKVLPPGSVQFAVTLHKEAVGKIEVEPTWNKSGEEVVGKILYELNNLNLEIPLHAKDCNLREFPHKGDIVRFDINQLKSTKETNAINVRIIESTHPKTTQQSSNPEER